MAAAIVPRPPWCPTPGTDAHNSHPTCYTTSLSLKLEKISLLLLIILLNTQHVNIDDAFAGNDTCSFVLGISGGFDAIDSSYGPIGSIPWLDSSGGGEEGKQNMGNAEVILGGQK